jgi:RHS repeat-associated protein
VGVADKVTNSAVCFGGCLQSQGTLGTDKLFTGQRLDSSGLYYYGARYYDPTIGRFISADSIVQTYKNPQALNRYSYVFNNPLKYVDPSGSVVEIQYENEVSAYFSGMMQYGIVAESGSMDQKIEEYSTYQQVWNDIKEEMPVETKAMEQAEETYFIGSSTTLEIYTPQTRLVFPSTRSTTQIEGLSDINTGYEDINATLGEIVVVTMGDMFYSKGDEITKYHYFGGGIGTSGLSYTGSQNSVSPGWNIAFTANAAAGIQIGYSLGKGGGWFFEYGTMWPPGVSLTVFYAKKGVSNK